MDVIKRDGRKVLFNRDKIITAIESAFDDVDGVITPSASAKAETIAKQIEAIDRDMTVEEIQDEVVERLMDSKRKDVAAAYVIYRNDRSRVRHRNEKLIQEVGEKLRASNVQNQNANVDEKSFGGRTGEATSVLTK